MRVKATSVLYNGRLFLLYPSFCPYCLDIMEICLNEVFYVYASFMKTWSCKIRTRPRTLGQTTVTAYLHFTYFFECCSNTAKYYLMVRIWFCRTHIHVTTFNDPYMVHVIALEFSVLFILTLCQYCSI